LSTPAVRLSNVTKSFGAHTAVRDLSLEVPRGSLYGFIGPNGSGKTTTIRMILHILSPDSGQVEVLGESGTRASNDRIGYLPEERGLYPKMPVVELLQFFAELRGVSPKDGRRRAHEWLERLELASWAHNKVEDLSKGMQQKIQFTTAVIHEPDILILDEPWSGLDPLNAEVLRDIVLEQKAAGRTIIFSTHLMEQAEKICDRVCIIARGRKVLEGELDVIKREAGGDRRIALRFGSAQESAQATDGVLATAASVREHGDGLLVELAEGSTPAELLEALNRSELSIRRFEIYEPSLHQIFVDEVGEKEASDGA